MLKLIPIFCLMLSALTTTLAQKQKEENNVDFDFGKVSAEDLKMKIYTPDSSAEAVVLTEKGAISIDFGYANDMKLHLHILRRIKMLKNRRSMLKERCLFAIIGLIDSSINYIKAAVIQPDGKRQELAKKEIIEEKTSDKIRTQKFTFPNLTEGCIVEYEYEEEFNNFINFPDWTFQDDIPVKHSEIWYYVPEYFDFVFLNKGRPKIKSEQKPNNFSDGVIIHVKKFSLDTVVALKEENYITTMDDFKSTISTQLRRIKHPNGRVQEYKTTWGKVAETFMKREDLGEQMTARKNYSKVWREVKPLVEAVESDSEKILIIYNYLNKNINWEDRKYSIYATETLNDAFEKKKAKSGELNLMMIACLKEAGIKASPMLVSTRSNGKPITLYSISDQFNHLACYIERGEKSIIADVGNIYRPLGLPRVQTLNGEGWILDVNAPRWVNIPAPSSNKVILANFKLDSLGTMRGSINGVYKGYAATSEREDETEKENKHEKIKKALANDYKDIKIDSISTKNLENLSEAFKRTISCEIPNIATAVDNLMYVKPTLKTDFDENPFKLPKREFPIEFPYPTKDQFILNLTIPEGYTVEEMPKSLRLSLPDDGGSFTYLSSFKDGVIQLMVKVQITQLIFQPEEYANVKEFFNQIAAKSTEQIVLKKNKS